MIELWTVQLLGSLCARQGEHVLTRFRTHKTGALLAYLAFHGDRVHSREVLSEIFWPESKEGTGLHSLRMALTSLRRQLEPPGVPGGAVLHTDRNSVRLNPLAFTTDVTLFEAALQQAALQHDPACKLQSLMQATEFYRGELLPGFYESWILPQALRLEECYFGAVEELLALLEDAGKTAQALEFATRATMIVPKHEDTRLALIRIALKSGRPDLARRHCREYMHLQVQGQDCPSPAFYRLCQQLGVLEADVVSPAKRSSLPADSSHSTSAVASNEATLRQQNPTPGWQPPRLPAALTRFFGRAEELARLQALLLSTPHPPRLLTLTGAGGSGKTRLALQLAERMQVVFPHAVWFVPLADISDARLLPEILLKAVGLPRIPGADPLEQAGTYLAQQPALLLLDNFEHLVEEGAELVGRLLENAPQLTCLITSRQRLEWEGEQEFPIAPLPLPSHSLSLERLMEFACVQLLVDRAQAAQPDFQLTRTNARAITELCRRLEGIPLALELAASRIHVLSPAQMLAQLSDRFGLLVTSRRNVSPRHRSLWATLEWSYDLLPSALKPFFRALSVFRGGWTTEAAASVFQQAETLDTLAQLRQRSLILTEEYGEAVRFQMLETIREFAEAQQDAEERAHVSQLHADTYLRLAEQASQSWMGRGEKAWMDRLELENENLRATLNWYQLSAENAARGLRLANALWRFWLTRSYLEEGSERLQTLLTLTQGQDSIPGRARALIHYGILMYAQSDFMQAQTYLKAGLALSREQENEADVALALNNLGLVWFHLRETTRAHEFYEEALAIRRRREDKAGIAASLANLGYLCLRQKELDRAQALFEESLMLRQELGDEVGRADVLAGLGHTTWYRFGPEQAKSYFCESLKVNMHIENYRDVVGELETLIVLASSLGNAVRAAHLAGATATLNATLGLPESQKMKVASLHLAQVWEPLGEAAFQAAYEAGRAFTLEEAVAEAQQI